jgi:hypothetical protein
MPPLQGMLNERLATAVGAASAKHPPLHFVQCSSPLPTGAIILHGFVDDGASASVIVKTARNPVLPHSLQREWEALGMVRRDPSLAGVTPAGLATFELDGAQYFVYSAVRGRTMSAAFRNRFWLPRTLLLKRFAARALQAALLVHRSSSRLAPSTVVATDLLDELEALRRAVPLLPSSVCRTAIRAVSTIASASSALPFGRVHGDFSPHNLLIGRGPARGSTPIIDWEHMEADRPQHLDIFRFIGSSMLLGKRGAERRLARRTMPRNASPFIGALLRPWLTAMGADATAWIRPDRLEALWWHYWIHAARRELERLATTDPRDSAFLQGVAEVAE